MKFSINYFLSKCDQICSFLRIWSHFLKKSLMKTSFFLQCGKLYFLCSDCKRQDIFQIIIDFRQLRNSAAEFKNTLETFWYRSVLKYQNDPKWQCWFASKNNLFETDFFRCFWPYYVADINEITKIF